MLLLILLALFLSPKEALFGESDASNYSVDISFLVADLKYSQTEGVKICEVQHGILSTFDGDIFCHGGRGTIAPAAVRWLSEFGKNIWSVKLNIAESAIRLEATESKSWLLMDNMMKIRSDKIFMELAKHLPTDPCNIADYFGFVFLKIPKLSERENLLEKYPGLIIIDNASYPYWIDKYSMSLLFEKHPLLVKAKPRWGLYQKKYSSKLAAKIIDDLQCDRFVIKPRSEFLGKGVIIVDKSDLDTSLKIILKKNRYLKKHPDPSHSYWYRNEDEAFIVEQFIESDSLRVPHLGNRTFDPTMRAAYLMKYDQKKVELKFLGANWFMPSHSIDQSGTLNQKHKGCNEKPYYAEVEEKCLSNVREQLDEVMLELYRQMLYRS